MTKRDYEAVTRAFQRARDHVKAASFKEKQMANQALYVAAESIAAAIARDNPEFKRAQFLTACGVGI